MQPKVQQLGRFGKFSRQPEVFARGCRIAGRMIVDENKRRGYPEDYGINEEEYRNLGWKNAETRGKWLLLRDKIVEAESMSRMEDDRHPGPDL